MDKLADLFSKPRTLTFLPDKWFKSSAIFLAIPSTQSSKTIPPNFDDFKLSIASFFISNGLMSTILTTLIFKFKDPCIILGFVRFQISL